MPELPEIELYLEALRRRVVGHELESIRVRSVSLIKTWDPPLGAADGRKVLEARRLGKRVVFALEGDLYIVIHLMISGRFQWRDKGGAPIPKKRVYAGFDFPNGTLLLTEASTHKRATLHLVAGKTGLESLDPGGIEPLDASFAEFKAALTRENHTLKRALTDPRLLSGIGNAHSDEILLDARLSPLKRTAQLDDDELRRLYDAANASLRKWTELLIAETGDEFPTRVTAFHPAMNAHGKFGQPCGNCGTAIQRIVHRGARSQLLPCVPDGRSHPQGPLPFPSARRRLATYSGGDGAGYSRRKTVSPFGHGF